MGHIFIHAMGCFRDLMTALMGSGLALGNAEAITSYDLLGKACIWDVAWLYVSPILWWCRAQCTASSSTISANILSAQL